MVESLVAVSSDPSDPLLVVLLGPTASGKTSLSIELAAAFSGEIVSCDSIAVYRGLEIGAAKPLPSIRRLAPHHLIDVVSLDESYSAGDYSRAARSAITGITSRERLPIVTGGTGFYLSALLHGLFAGAGRSEDLRRRLRDRASRRGAAYLHRLLARLDPAASARIHPNDLPKAIRAIEVSVAGRKPISQAWESGREEISGYRILKIGLQPDRGKLYARIDARARAMFAEGLIEETRSLLGPDRASSADAEIQPALRSLGYRQAVAYLHGAMTLDQAIASACQGHRNYAKRQITWFRREADVVWLSGFGDEDGVRKRAMSLVAEGLRR